MKYAVLKPKEGMIVRDPISKLALPSEGKKVKVDTYWQRRINDGDVTVVSTVQPESQGE